MLKWRSIVGIPLMVILATAACTTRSDTDASRAVSTISGDVSMDSTSTPAGIQRVDLDIRYGEIWIESLPELVPSEPGEVDLYVVSGGILRIFANDCRTPLVQLDSWVSDDEPYLGSLTRFFEAFPTDDDLPTRDLSLYIDPDLDTGLFRLWVTCSLIADGTDDYREINIEVIERPDLAATPDAAAFPVIVCPADAEVEDDCRTENL